MSQVNVLVTGGAGYIGTELVAKLAADPQVGRVIVYDNLSRGSYNIFLGPETAAGKHKLVFVRGELLDSRGLRRALQGVDVVYHLAAKVTTPFANSDVHNYEQVNHWGTAELTYAIEASSVRRVIYTSSTGVYGSSPEPVDEQSLTNPKTFYAISKLRGEEHIRRISEKIETYIVRCGNVYGYSKSMRFDAVINRFAFEANFHRKVMVEGDGRQSRAFINIDAVSTALQRLLAADLACGVYNLVEHNLQVIEVVDELKKLVPELEFGFINQRVTPHELNVKRNEMLNTRLGIAAQRTFGEELAEFLTRFSF